MCGSDCYCLGYKVEIPRKSDARGWKALRMETRQRHFRWSESQALRRVRVIHEAERRIAHLRSLGPNKDRERTIKKLKKHANP